MSDTEQEDGVYYRTQYEAPGTWFRLEARRDGRIHIRFGDGSVAAVMQLIAGWEHVWATLEPEVEVTIVADMSQANKASLRVQYLIGKWLLDHKSRIRKIAIHGAGAVQVAIVTSVMTVARIHKIRFFVEETPALDWASS